MTDGMEDPCVSFVFFKKKSPKELILCIVSLPTQQRRKMNMFSLTPNIVDSAAYQSSIHSHFAMCIPAIV